MALILKQCWFQCPNEIFDDGIIRDLSGNATKILWFIYRKTFGFHKTADRIPYSQIKDALGIIHKDTIQRAILELVKADLIIRTGNNTSGYSYAPKVVDETGSKNEPTGEGGGPKIEPVQDRGGSKIEPEVVQKSHQCGSEIEPVLPETGSIIEPSKDSLKDKGKRQERNEPDPGIRKMILDRFEQLYKREFNGCSPAKKTKEQAIAQNVAIKKLLDSGETPARIMVSLDAYFTLDNDFYRRTIPVFCKHYHDVSELIRARDGGDNPGKSRDGRRRNKPGTDVGYTVADLKTIFDE